MFNFGKIKDAGGLFIKGLALSYAPEIARGMVVELLKEPVIYKGATRRVDTLLITDLVAEDVCLWDLLNQNGVKAIKDTARRLGDISWFTSGWLIESIRGDYPALASQFLGWDAARAWLDRQFEELRRQIGT